MLLKHIQLMMACGLTTLLLTAVGCDSSGDSSARSSASDSASDRRYDWSICIDFGR